ncbi:MAG: LAGLIDADG family homing endonuclease [Candidatus Paceibacterota bacterium]
MGKRGPKPKGKVKIEWSPNFAYAIGLLVSDGSLSINGRHITFTSKDLELIEIFQKALEINIHIGKKSSAANQLKRYFVTQFSDVLFYAFLLRIGLMPNKSKIIGKIKVPDKYFFDFLRGSFDGDGCTHSYFDPRWKSSFMFYTTFVSASQTHILWLQENIKTHLQIQGHITGNGIKAVYQLRYAKADSLKLLRKMYPNIQTLCLTRKRLKIERMLHTIGQRL